LRLVVLFAVALPAQALRVLKHVAWAALHGQRNDVVVLGVPLVRPARAGNALVVFIAFLSALLADPAVTLEDGLPSASWIKRDPEDFATLP